MEEVRAGKKRKLKRRERNHALREQKARMLENGGTQQNADGERPANNETADGECVPLELRPATADPALTERELAAVVDQLGFMPTNLIRVAAFDAITHQPTVCQLYPLTKPAAERRRKGGGKDFEPFPTTYWLTCPTLKANISKLEDKGWVAKLETRLEKDEAALHAMANAHNEYAACRWALLSDEHLSLVSERGWTEPLKEVGIAGIRNHRKVKCLHTMYAHWLAVKSSESSLEEALKSQGGDSGRHSGRVGNSGKKMPDQKGSASSAEEAPPLIRQMVHPVGDWIHELLSSQDEPTTGGSPEACP